MRLPLAPRRIDVPSELFSHKACQDSDGSRIAVGHFLDLLHHFSIEHGLVLRRKQFFLRGNEQSQFGFKQFGDLPEHVKRSALPASLDIDHRCTADPETLGQGILAQMLVLSRLTDLPSHSTINLVEVRH